MWCAGACRAFLTEPCCSAPLVLWVPLWGRHSSSPASRGPPPLPCRAALTTLMTSCHGANTAPRRPASGTPEWGPLFKGAPPPSEPAEGWRELTEKCWAQVCACAHMRVRVHVRVPTCVLRARCDLLCTLALFAWRGHSLPRKRRTPTGRALQPLSTHPKLHPPQSSHPLPPSHLHPKRRALSSPSSSSTPLCTKEK